jgi:hypothetical protein
MKKAVVVYWLIPTQPYRELFRDIIRILAKQYDAPRFEPHVTLCPARDRRSWRKVRCAPIRLRVRGIAYSSKFTKTLFIRFHPNESLGKLVRDLGGTPPRDPHVSLIYQKMPVPTKRELAATIKLPFPEVVFDSIKAVRCPLPTETRRNVESWRAIARQSLRD